MFYKDIIDLLKAREPGIWVVTSEEKEVILSLRNAIEEVGEYDSICTYSLTEGAYELKSEDQQLIYEPLEDSKSLLQLDALLKAHNSENSLNRIWILKDFHLAFSNPAAIRMLRDLKEHPIKKYVPIIILSPSNEIPLELKSLFKVMDYETPKKEDIKELINIWLDKKNLSLTADELTTISKRLYGFTRSEIVRMLNLSFVKHGHINLNIINENKINIIKQSGILDYKEPTFSLNDLGGNDKFKKWVLEVEQCMGEDAKEFGIPTPKGYLSVGIPGTSKTASAEAIAGRWSVPYIKLNMSKITSRFAGETERNMYKALNIVKSCAPCVFLIDEIEKSLGGYKSSNSTDSGAIARAFGNILEFLNENDNGVFVVMTSNDVTQLPPELTRAGRLDAIWYFGLPSIKEREEILTLHLNKTGKNIEEMTIKKAAKLMDKYTGAEIELVVKSSLRKLFLQKKKNDIANEITYDILKEAISEVIPIATSSKEQILSLDRWAQGKALFAHEQDLKILNNNAVKSVPKINIKK